MLTSRFWDAKRSVDLDKIPDLHLFFQDTGHLDCQFFFHSPSLESPDLAYIESGDSERYEIVSIYILFLYLYLYVEMIKFDGETFCADHAVAIIIGCLLTVYDMRLIDYYAPPTVSTSK